MNIQQHLIAHHINTNAIRAVAQLNAEMLSTDEYNDRLTEMGNTQRIDDQLEAKYTYLYAVQNALKGDLNIATARMQAKRFIAENEWSFASQEESDTVVDKNTGEARRKKGWKKVEAVKIAKELGLENRKEIIKAFQEKLDMSKSGATTYYYIAKEEIEG